MSAEDEHVSKKQKKGGTDLPTQYDQKQLQQMEILMKSNLLQLHTKELLQNVDANVKFSSKKLNEWLEQLKTDLQSTAKYTCHNREITNEWLDNQSYGLELNLREGETCQIAYIAPKQVEVVGSFDSNTGTAPLYNIDIAVTIPAEILSSRFVSPLPSSPIVFHSLTTIFSAGIY